MADPAAAANLPRGRAGTSSTRQQSRSWTAAPVAAAIALLNLLPSASAAFVPFHNCLDQSTLNPQQPSGLKLLQFVPLFVEARFNASDRAHSLNVTVYGNVTGQTWQDPLPLGSNFTYWNNPNNTEGKVCAPQSPTMRSL